MKEIVIKISDSLYDKLINMNIDSDTCSFNESVLVESIQNGILLPKGHGELKDSKLLDTRLNFVLNHTGGYKNTPIGTGIVIAMAENLDAKTIIEADETNSEGTE